jgi:predicted Rossmann fold nucleotide-binding protein DprA/Smf involved in DNA uptake
MNIGVVGSRTFNNYSLLKQVLDRFVLNVEEKPLTIVSGGAKGADSLARRYCEEHNIQIVEFLPEWDKYGRGAGPIRNKKIVDYSDFIVAFWDGCSRGTASTIRFAKQMDKQVFIHWEN